MKSDFSTVNNLLYKLLKRENPAEETLQSICDILKENIYHYDWVGFYVMDTASKSLTLGAYRGKPTEHTVIPVGKGICGQVAESKQTIIAQDVSKEKNYIACSINVQSEIVVPIIKDNRFVAELDIDSHLLAPFTSADKTFLERVCSKIAHLF